MEGIEKITAKLEQDAQAEIGRLMAEADQKTNEMSVMIFSSSYLTTS